MREVAAVLHSDHCREGPTVHDTIGPVRVAAFHMTTPDRFKCIVLLCGMIVD